ncbi:S9 family peptidase [Muribaculum sp.]|uniref:S9 family peptidase n=1 Tax=Muribaculum sp. TaxID=1918611 RepID=UPI0023D2A9DC|nr:S9 family peptidase [Muribaculum sp.]MDE5704518.1 S9 family peptidase [Muribaculum sp.]
MISRIILSAAILCAPSIYAASVKSSDIAPYVYPQNAPDAPQAMAFGIDGKTYTALADGGKRLVRYDIRTGKEIATVIDVKTTRDNQIQQIAGYTFSPDESYVLVYAEKEPVYRRSFTAEYYIYEVRHNVLSPLSTKHPRQRAPQWSPDGRMIAFAADGNIYISKLDYLTEVAVTADGAKNSVINGVPDWSYEEEFDTTCSMAWAPDNTTLCYLKYDESAVPLYSFPLYQGTCNPDDAYALYPGNYSYKYPVAGEKNVTVSLHSYDVDLRKTKTISFSDSRIEYIPRIEYAPSSDRLMVTTLNRAQNRMEIYSVNPKSTVSKSVYVDESRTGWIDPMAYEGMKLLPEGFVVMSERSGFNHLYLYSYAGALQRQITSGDYDVTAYYGYDAKSGTHYYQAASTSPLSRVVSRIDAKGRVSHISPENGTSAAVFTPAMDLCVLSYSNVTAAPVYTLVTPSNGKSVRTLVDNKEYMARYPRLPRKEFFTMNSDGYTLNGYILRPADFDASRRYPVIMYQYSGPGSQEVLDRWRMDWDYFFTTQGYVIICVDGRGTGGRGTAFKHTVYRRLGQYETIDQINAARYAASLPFVDSNRIGIFGWSYGGYEALMAASEKGAPYRAVVAVAPVTSWRYYDTIYTERYMLTPAENSEGYDLGAPINRTSSLAGDLLIMHGTADDNVHLMNTMQYVSVLESQGNTCDMLLFPNMNHSIYGCGARAVVYLKMLKHFDRSMR